MASLRMSLGTAIFIAYLYTPYVKGITETMKSYAEGTPYCFADVAHMNRSESAIRSSGQEWYQDGMEIFAWQELFKYWSKSHLKWALMDEPVILPRETVMAALRRGFDQWQKASVFTFQEVSPSDQPDIKVEFVYEKAPSDWPREWREKDEDIAFVKFDDFLTFRNNKPRHIQFAKTQRWVDRSRSDWRNFRFFALRAIGTALGMGHSTNQNAIMYAMCDQIHRGARSTEDFDLYADDDVYGIQYIYGRLRKNTPNRTYRPPSPSSSEDESSAPRRSSSSRGPRQDGSAGAQRGHVGPPRGQFQTYGGWPPSRGGLQTYGGGQPSRGGLQTSGDKQPVSPSSSTSSSTQTSSGSSSPSCSSSTSSDDDK